MVKFILSIAILAVFIPPLSAAEISSRRERIEEALKLAAAEPQAVTPSEENNDNPDSAWQIPDWLKRTDYGIIVETKQQPRYYLETVQPLYQSLDDADTFFTHDRISIQDERSTFSTGLGYRRLMLDDNLLAGFNSFFDYQDLHQHYRTGVGLEALSKKIEFRSNFYFGLSARRTVEETSTTFIYEKAVDGYDAELGGPVPYLPWLKLFGSYYFYNFEKFSDMKGYKTRAEIKPFKFIVFNFETYDDNKGEREYRCDGRFNLNFSDFTPKSIFAAFQLAREPYPEVDLKEHTLDRVERNFNIQVEKWSEAKTGGMTVEIGRSN